MGVRFTYKRNWRSPPARFLSHDFVNSVHEIDRAAQVSPFRICEFGSQQRVGHGIECGADGYPRVIVRFLGNNLGSQSRYRRT